MEWILYTVARIAFSLIKMMPLSWVAALGRYGGMLACKLDRRHRRVAIDNLQHCFGNELDSNQIKALAVENFKRIGENYACAIKTATMDNSQIPDFLTLSGGEKVVASTENGRGAIMAIGHFGNFELYARASYFIDGFQMATTYRGLPQASLNRLMQNFREKSGCLYFERRTDANALRHALNSQRLMLGLLVDQHAGDHGLGVPFFGRECSTSTAPAIYALRYHLPLHVAICYRIAPAKWHIEVSDAIPTHENGSPRPLADILIGINQEYEKAIRRDPANWFWVHRRWKPVRRHVKNKEPVTGEAVPPEDLAAGTLEKPKPEQPSKQA